MNVANAGKSTIPPVDPAMPQLAAALDLDIAARLIAPVAGGLVVSARAVRHKPGRRAMIEYTIRTPTGALKKLLGKVRAKGLDRRAHDALSAVRASGLDARVASVPRAVGVVPELNLWLQEKVDGVDFCASVELWGASVAARRAAMAICELHRSPYRPARIHTTADELAILGGRLAAVAAVHPQAASSLARVTRACESLAQTFPPRRLCLIHRDFYHDQVVFGEGETWLVDLDLCALGDPALDVGNFAAHLIELAIRQPAAEGVLRGCAEEFVDTCLAANPLSARRVIEGFVTLALARHLSICMQFPDRADAFERILSEVESRLFQ